MNGVRSTVLVASLAAVSSVLGGLLGGWRRPSTLASSVALGSAAGVLLGTITFEMLARAEELASPALAAVGFFVGVALMFAFDLSVQRGRTAGREADLREQTRRFHEHHEPHGDQVTTLAGGTTVEEVIEGSPSASVPPFSPGSRCSSPGRSRWTTSPRE